MSVANTALTSRLQLDQLDRYRRAANYLGAIQLYLRDNVLLQCFGLKIDRKRNQSVSGDANVADKNQHVAICVIKSEECWALARECFKILNDELKV